MVFLLSLMQLARAYTIFTNDGELKPVSFLRLDQPLPGKQVIRRTLRARCATC